MWVWVVETLQLLFLNTYCVPDTELEALRVSFHSASAATLWFSPPIFRAGTGTLRLSDFPNIIRLSSRRGDTQVQSLSLVTAQEKGHTQQCLFQEIKKKKGALQDSAFSEKNLSVIMLWRELDSTWENEKQILFADNVAEDSYDPCPKTRQQRRLRVRWGLSVVLPSRALTSHAPPGSSALGRTLSIKGPAVGLASPSDVMPMSSSGPPAWNPFGMCHFWTSLEPWGLGMSVVFSCSFWKSLF